MLSTASIGWEWEQQVLKKEVYRYARPRSFSTLDRAYTSRAYPALELLEGSFQLQSRQMQTSTLFFPRRINIC
jgi:hypothetical protein